MSLLGKSSDRVSSAELNQFGRAKSSTSNFPLLFLTTVQFPMHAVLSRNPLHTLTHSKASAD